MNKMLFQLGGVVMTRGARELMEIEGLDPVHYLARHVTGDWGDWMTRTSGRMTRRCEMVRASCLHTAGERRDCGSSQKRTGA